MLFMLMKLCYSSQLIRRYGPMLQPYWLSPGIGVRFVHRQISPIGHISPMMPSDPTMLERFARKYVWWTTTDVAVTMPERVVAHVMNIGDYDDVQTLASESA